MTKQFAWEEERMEEDFNEAGDKMEPFNLKTERTEGYFDETGHFVWKKEEGGEDPWLASLENEEDLEARIGEAAVARKKKCVWGEMEGSRGMWFAWWLWVSSVFRRSLLPSFMHVCVSFVALTHTFLTPSPPSPLHVKTEMMKRMGWKNLLRSLTRSCSKTNFSDSCVLARRSFVPSSALGLGGVQPQQQQKQRQQQQKQLEGHRKEGKQP